MLCWATEGASKQYKNSASTISTSSHFQDLARWEFFHSEQSDVFNNFSYVLFTDLLLTVLLRNGIAAIRLLQVNPTALNQNRFINSNDTNFCTWISQQSTVGHCTNRRHYTAKTSTRTASQNTRYTALLFVTLQTNTDQFLPCIVTSTHSFQIYSLIF